MNELAVFNFDDSQVRAEIDEFGEPLFVLADVCRAIGLTRKPAAVVERLDPDGVRRSYPISDSMGRRQLATMVNEAGLYETIVRSDSPDARPFRRWVTHEVLPTLRKTGSYSVAPQYTLPATYTEALRELAATVEAKEAVEREKRAIEATATEQAEIIEIFSGTEGHYLLRDAVKILRSDHLIEISEKLLRQHLIEWRWCYRGTDGALRPMASHSTLGPKHFILKPVTYDYDGERHSGPPQMRVTNMGVVAIAKKLKKELAA